MAEQTMRAYHFLRADMTAGHGDEPPWRVGEERHINGPIALCERGYHFVTDWLSGLEWAPGPMACLVEVWHPVEIDNGKGVSHQRKLLAAADTSRELRLFACDCAERALVRERDAGREPDPRSWEAIRVARAYANGEATDAAREAAWAAARHAAWAAARHAAWVGSAAASAAAWAACAAARDAASAAARHAAGAAWAAASAVARDAAWDASDAARSDEVAWQRARLAEYLDPLVGGAS